MSLKIEKLSYTYMKGTPFEKKALENIDFEIQDGEFVGIIGHTGCGKSTLVQHFNGLLKPEEGNIYIDGQLMNHSNLKEMRKQVGLVFQYPEYQLFESTVYKDIAFGIKSEGLTPEEEYRRVLDAAQKTGLPEELLESSIYDLSGGQKRRAAIAGIIVMNPKILVLDEPAAGLDPAGRDDILYFAKRLRDENGITVILVSHSMEDIAKLADKV
ncbi:MAG: ATP-binding cassette domain-containing protein, partial [Clostridia bacterium]